MGRTMGKRTIGTHTREKFETPKKKIGLSMIGIGKDSDQLGAN